MLFALSLYTDPRSSFVRYYFNQRQLPQRCYPNSHLPTVDFVYSLNHYSGIGTTDDFKKVRNLELVYLLRYYLCVISTQTVVDCGNQNSTGSFESKIKRLP
jgi:hypothetical protein